MITNQVDAVGNLMAHIDLSINIFNVLECFSINIIAALSLQNLTTPISQQPLTQHTTHGH